MIVPVPPHSDGPHAIDVQQVAVPTRPLSRFETIVGRERYEELRRAAATAREELRGRRVWNVSSTASGGGVAEMLYGLIGYTLDAGIDIRWLVIRGDHDFFAITKRVHNRLHGAPGDGGDLGTSESAHYTEVTAANAASAIGYVQRGDIVLLHDPQTLGMAAPLAEAGAQVVWRCHVGHEADNEWTVQAWSFLRPHLAGCAASVFSIRSYVPSWMDDSKTWVIPPSIDPFSPKNQEMARADLLATLQHIGLLSGGEKDRRGTFTRHDGTTGRVERRASVLCAEDSPLGPRDQLVIQVSRWDKLKDMTGVLNGFAASVVGRVDAHLALVGPATAGVTDDPEGAEVLAECEATWRALPVAARRRTRIVVLPMEDIDENAAMVNALQRQAAVIVQKSLAEGFGLTVAEGMWKAKPVVASRVGGIVEQIAPGTGILLDDPTDLAGFGDALAALLQRPDEIMTIGARAREHVLEGFVGDKHLIRYAELIGRLVDGG
jgi:trehalose synthase